MAILSNINGKFAVDSTGAIQLSGSAGTANYVLVSGGAGVAAGWANLSTNDINSVPYVGGPYLKLIGGTLSGNLSITNAITDPSLTVTTGATVLGGTLNVSDIITAPGGTSTEWNTAYDNSIVSLGVTGTTTKTLTATQQDGGTLTASWTDGGGDVTGSGTLNTVARWTATGSDIGDGPIVFSGAGTTATSTFGGKVIVSYANAALDLAQADGGAHFRMELDGGDETYLSTIGSNSMILRTNSTTALTIDTSQNATFSGSVTSNATPAFLVGTIGAIGNTANDVNIYSTTAGHNGLRMHVNGILPTNNAGTIIDNDADLGDPSYRFKDGYFAGDVNITQATDVGVLNVANLDSGAAVGLSLTYPTTNVAAGDGLAIAIGIAGRGRSYIANSNVTTNLDASNLVFYTEDGGVIGERMRIDSNGNVGIGVTPIRKFDVNGTSTFYDNVYITSSKQIQWEGGNYWTWRVSGTEFQMYRGDTAATPFTVNTSNNATFAGTGTFAGTVTAAQYYKSSTAYNVIGTGSSGEVILRPTAWNLSTAQSSFTTTLATIGTDATFAGNLNVNGNATLGDGTADNHTINGQVTQLTADALGYKLHRTSGGTSMLISATGDAELEFGTDNGSGTNTTHWTIGKDGTDNSFRISNSASLGTSDALTIDSSENSTFAGDVTIGPKSYPKLNLTDNTGVARNFSVGTNNETFTVRNETASSDALTIAGNTNDAIFGGDVTVGGGTLNISGGVAPIGVANIVSTDAGVGSETKVIAIHNSSFSFDHGSGSATTFIGNGSYEIDARGAIIGTNIYAKGSTIGSTSGGSFVLGESTSEGVYITRPSGTTDMVFYTGTNPRITIESNGEVGVNNTSPSATLHLTALASNGVPFKLQGHASTSVEQMLMYTTQTAGTGWYWLVAQANSVNQLIIYGTGSIENALNSYTGISDRKLKENIIDTAPKLEDIKKLRVINYNLIGDDKKLLGMVAQEVEEVFPGLVENNLHPSVNGAPREKIKSLKYSVLVPMLVKSIQELEARVKELENK